MSKRDGSGFLISGQLRDSSDVAQLHDPFSEDVAHKTSTLLFTVKITFLISKLDVEKLVYQGVSDITDFFNQNTKQSTSPCQRFTLHQSSR